MKTNQIIATIFLVLIASGVSFYGGTKYQQQKTTTALSQRFGNANGQFVPGQGNNRAINGTNGANRGQIPSFRQTIGEITSLDDKSITVKLTDGSSKIILLSDSTIISQSTTAAKTDLKVGVKVAIMGDTNTDGSVTSKNIEINPRVPTITPTVQK